MNAALEAKLWAFINNGWTPSNGKPMPRARDCINAMVEAGEINTPRQAHCTLEKWVTQGCYEYGVALDLGWVDHSGKQPHARWDAKPIAPRKSKGSSLEPATVPL